jgi:hypothetical protein
MKLYPHIEQFGGQTRVIIQARAEGDGMVGDASWVVLPGESAFDLDYDRWVDAANKRQAIDHG